MSTGTTPPQKSAAEKLLAEMARSAAMRTRAIWGLAGGIAALVLGYILTGFTSNGAALCSTTLGEIGSALDGQVAHDCGMYNTVSGLGSVLIGLGWLLAACAALLLLIGAIYRRVQQEKGQL